MLRSLATVLALVMAAPASGQEAADLILRGGVFYPVEPPGPIAGSLAVRGGRIVYLGSDGGAEAWRADGTRVVDLAGRAVTPGLIDAHSHLLGLGDALVQVDLKGTRSLEEVVERVRAAAREAPPGTWITGRGWDQNDWPDRRFPAHQRLSEAVPDHPVWMRRVDGHAALANRHALDALGIGPSTPDPAGGRIVRDEAGQPSGVLVDNAMDLARGRIPSPPPAERRRRLRLAAGHCAAVGLTTVTDMGVSAQGYEAYRALAADGELPIRAALFLTDDDALLQRWFAAGPEVDAARRLLVRGVKLYADGALGSRGAALLEPYGDDPGNFGLLVTPGARLADLARRALAAGFQVGVHAIGDRGAVTALDALEAALGGPRPAARFRIEHAQVVRPQDFERMARLGIIASMQPTHATSDMPWAPDRLGPERLERAYAWRKALNAGGRLALGSDFPVESADPRLGLYAAVTRQDLEGRPAGGWLPEERLTREEALRGFTLDAAYSLFLDEDVGSLAVGKQADLVVFAEDVMQVPVAHLPQVPVDLTIVAGEIIYERPSP